MLNNKKLNILISLIVASVLWIYVVGEIDPVITKKISGLPISFENEDVLAENGMAISEVSNDMVSVTIEGKRSNLSKVDEGDIKASIDLSQGSKGENSFSVSFKMPAGVERKRSNPSKVNIKIDKLVEVEKPIEVKFDGMREQAHEPIVLEQQLKSVVVRGAQSRISDIDKVAAHIDISSVSNDSKVIRAKLVAENKHGVAVPYVSFEPRYMNVTAAMGTVKSVPLDITVVGAESGDVKRKVSFPETIEIKGTEEDLKNIQSIKAERVDVSSVMESGKIEIKLILPDNIMLADEGKPPMVTVTVGVETKSKTITFSADEMIIQGLTDGLNATVKEGIKVTVNGKPSYIDSLNKQDIKIILDVSGLSEGETKVKPSVNIKEGFGSYSTDKESVPITIVSGSEG